MDDILAFNPSQLAVFNREEQPKSSGNENLYKPQPQLSKSEDGHYRATVKVIYSPHDLAKSILEVQSYGLQDADGWFTMVSSLTNDDKSCPIFKAWKQCHFSKDPVLQNQALSKDKGGKGLFDKRFARYATIQVIEDNNRPELVGRYMFMKLPKFIWEMINGKMNPSPESKKPSIPVMDFLFGRAIDLDVAPGPDDPKQPERKNREISYTGSELTEDVVSCMNPDGTPILNAEQQEILETYTDEMSKRVWKEKDPDKRATAMAEINANSNTAELRNIYKEVMEQIKAVCPNLVEEMGYRPWTPEQTARVQAWIDIVVAGGDPASYNKVPEAVKDAAQADEAAAKATGAAPAPESDNSDLPF